jgi:hypothetical protein
VGTVGVVVHDVTSCEDKTGRVKQQRQTDSSSLLHGHSKSDLSQKLFKYYEDTGKLFTKQPNIGQKFLNIMYSVK